MGNEKSVKDSAIEDQFHAILPNDLNSQGTIHGGEVLKLIDKVGGIAAGKHSGKVCVTAGLDSIDFIWPARIGDLLILKASVNNAWGSSCEVGVKVFAEDGKTKEVHHLASAYLTYVALDEERGPTPMPKIVPKTSREKRRFKEAEKRRKIRLKRREKRKRSEK